MCSQFKIVYEMSKCIMQMRSDFSSKMFCLIKTSCYFHVC